MKNFSRWQLELGMSMVNGQMVCLVAFRTKGDLSIGSLMAHHLAKQMHRQPRPHPLNSCSTNVLLHVSIYIYIHTYMYIYIYVCVYNIYTHICTNLLPAFCLPIGSRSLQLQMDLQFLTKPLGSQARLCWPSGVVASSSDFCYKAEDPPS